MKPRRHLPLLATLAFAHTATAQDIIKANNTDALNATTSWVGGSVPGSGNVAVWDSTVIAANTTSLGANQSWQGIRIANLTGIDWDSLTLDTPYTVLFTTQTFGTGDIDNFGIANAVPVGTGRHAYFTNGSLAVVVIPEPAAALLGSLGLLAMLRRKR
jgi:hypothetical protein